jgi:hypothetical protein
VLLAACGAGSEGSRPATVDDLASWLQASGECEEIETHVTKLPVPASRFEEVAPANERFDKQAQVAGLVGCGGLNGYVSYFRFPSTAARVAAVRGRNGLIANELFCAKGTELVINDLLGFDNTIGFCEKLGWQIHRPTGAYSPATERRHHLEVIAERLYSRATGYPLVNIDCESSGPGLEFECLNYVGGGPTEIVLVKKRGGYAIKGGVKG